MGEHAAFRATSSTGRIDNAGDILTLARSEDRVALATELLPAKCAGQFGTRGRFRNQNCPYFQSLELGRLHDGTPQIVFDNQHVGFRVRKKLQVLRRG